MLSVALETSQRAASVAIAIDGAIEECLLSDDRAHASDCLSQLDQLLQAAGRDPAEIDAVFVGTGPGSYTGLRIGIATALGLARGARASLRGESSGEVIVHRELAVGSEGVHLLDARQNELYFAHYRRGSEDVEVLCPPCVLRPTELEQRLPSGVPIFGDASALELAGLGESSASQLRGACPPRAGALLELGSRRLETLGAHEFDAVEPLYLRPFQAKLRRR